MQLPPITKRAKVDGEEEDDSEVVACYIYVVKFVFTIACDHAIVILMIKGPDHKTKIVLFSPKKSNMFRNTTPRNCTRE